MKNLVTIDILDRIAHVRLNRPEKRNALSIEMFHAIQCAAEQLMENRGIRAIVLSGEGLAFCSGFDLANFNNPEIFGDRFFAPGRGGFWPNFYQRAAYLWKDLPVPVIAAVHGTVFGGGLQLALAADIRIAHPQTTFSMMEVKWGLIPDMCATQTLKTLMRLDIAKELTFTGRIVDAQEAEKIGLVTRIDEAPLDAAFALAREIAKKSPDAVSYGKLALEATWHEADNRGLELEEKLQDALIKGPNQAQSVLAGMKQQTPNFQDRTLIRIDRANPLNGVG